MFLIGKSYGVLEVRVSIYAQSDIEFSFDLDQSGSWAEYHNVAVGRMLLILLRRWCHDDMDSSGR